MMHEGPALMRLLTVNGDKVEVRLLGDEGGLQALEVVPENAKYRGRHLGLTFFEWSLSRWKYLYLM
jgi:hypothetical protein